MKNLAHWRDIPIGIPMVIAFGIAVLGYACGVPAASTSSTQPSSVQKISVPGGWDILVVCDPVNGNLIYQEVDHYTIDVVSGGCPKS